MSHKAQKKNTEKEKAKKVVASPTEQRRWKLEVSSKRNTAFYLDLRIAMLSEEAKLIITRPALTVR